MFVSNLYERALVQPNEFANQLYAVSGYASATFARRHISELIKKKDDVSINLIIGMPGTKNDHLAYISLINEFSGRFRGYYLQNSPPVHCKVYSWFKDKNPVVGFAGSANYSQFGFFVKQQMNQLSDEDPVLIKNLFDELLQRCIYIPDLAVDIPLGHRQPQITESLPPGEIEWEIPDKRVTISFLDKRTGDLPPISGLNWGQRLAKGKINKRTGLASYTKRNPNQAYLSLKKDSRKEGFLPPRALTFSLITDDKETMDCVVAQDGRKAIQTTNDNSLIGRYFRKRLGVPLGQPVTVNDLEKYGRTDFTLEKIDDETILLDFSV